MYYINNHILISLYSSSKFLILCQSLEIWSKMDMLGQPTLFPAVTRSMRWKNGDEGASTLHVPDREWSAHDGCEAGKPIPTAKVGLV